MNRKGDLLAQKTPLRYNQNMKIKKLAKPLIIIFASIFVLCALLQLLCLFFVHQSFRPLPSINAPDSPHFVQERKRPYNSDDPVEVLNYNEKERCYPILKSISQKVSIKSFDGLNLNAHLAEHKAEAPNHNYIILMHGFRDSPKIVSPYAIHFYNNGFNILVPGQRGHGWSEGKHIDMSAFTPQDVKSWIDFICQKDSDAKIALWGISMGGSTVMRATGLSLPSNVVCCIEDCGFSSVWDEFVYQMKTAYKIPGKLLMPYFNLYCKRKLGIDCKIISAKDDLKRSVTPTLFIHGDADTFVPFYMLNEVYDSAACTKEMLIIPAANHARSAFAAPESYWQATDDFLAKYF